MSDASVRVIDGRAVVKVGGSELLTPIVAQAERARDAVKPIYGVGAPAADQGMEGSWYRDMTDVFSPLEYFKTAAGWQGPRSLRGNPGGNVMAVGLFAEIGSFLISAGTNLIQTSGHTVVGIGSGRYFRVDVSAIPAGDRAQPYRVQSEDGGWWQLEHGRITAQQFGVLCDGSDQTAMMQASMDYVEAGDAWVLESAQGLGTKISGTIAFNAKTKFAANGSLILIDYDDPRVVSNGDVAALLLSGCTDFDVQGFNIDIINQASQQTGIYILGGCRRGRVHHNKLNNARWAGIAEYTAVANTNEDIAIEDNEIFLCRFGINHNGRRTAVRRNKITDHWSTSPEHAANPIWQGTSLYYDGILTAGGSDWVIEENSIFDKGQSAWYLASTDGKGRVSANRFRANWNKGIDCGPTIGRGQRLIITDNIVEDHYSGEISLVNSDNCVVSRNQVTVSKPASFGIGLHGNCFRNVAKDNVLAVTDPSYMHIFVENDPVKGGPAVQNIVRDNPRIGGSGGGAGVSINTAANAFTDDPYA